MAHFAKIDVNNIVKQVEVVSNDVATTEQDGIDFLKQLYGDKFKWIQTSYIGSFRKNFAGIGSSYDQERDAFINPKPFDSWTLDEPTCQWIPPTPKPDGYFNWNESTKAWDAVD